MCLVYLKTKCYVTDLKEIKCGVLKMIVLQTCLRGYSSLFNLKTCLHEVARKNKWCI